MRPVVAIVGAGQATAEQEQAAEALGAVVIAVGARLLTGGRGGVMAAASRGARRAPGWREGDVLAVLPGTEADAANPYVDVALPTGLGHARNAVVVTAARAVLAVGGAGGTVSEVALAHTLGRPVAVLDLGGASPAAARGLGVPVLADVAAAEAWLRGVLSAD